MRFNLGQNPRSHYVYAAIQGHCLTLLHERRSLLGWRCGQAATFALPEADFQTDALVELVRPWLAQQRIPAGTAVALVLPPEIAGLVVVDSSSDDVGDALVGGLPFPLAEIGYATLAAEIGRNRSRSVLWLHNDWQEELRGGLAKLGLVLDEIFARAQLHGFPADAFTPHYRAPYAVLEGESGRFGLHLFESSGKPFRSVALTDDDEALRRRIRAELTSAEMQLGVAVHRLVLAEDAARLRDLLIGLDDVLLVSGGELLTANEALTKLRSSGTEGKWYPPSLEEVQRLSLRWTVGASVAGLALMGALWWQTDAMQAETASLAASEKKLRPRYQLVVETEKRLFVIGQAVRVTTEFGPNVAGATLDPLVRLTEALPAGVVLTEYRFAGGSVRFAGTGANAAMVLDRLRPLAELTQITPVALPPGAPEENFAFEARWTPAGMAGAGAGAKGA